MMQVWFDFKSKYFTSKGPIGKNVFDYIFTFLVYLVSIHIGIDTNDSYIF